MVNLAGALKGPVVPRRWRVHASSSPCRRSSESSFTVVWPFAASATLSLVWTFEANAGSVATSKV